MILNNMCNCKQIIEDKNQQIKEMDAVISNLKETLAQELEDHTQFVEQVADKLDALKKETIKEFSHALQRTLKNQAVSAEIAKFTSKYIGEEGDPGKSIADYPSKLIRRDGKIFIARRRPSDKESHGCVFIDTKTSKRFFNDAKRCAQYLKDKRYIISDLEDSDYYPLWNDLMNSYGGNN